MVVVVAVAALHSNTQTPYLSISSFKVHLPTILRLVAFIVLIIAKSGTGFTARPSTG